MRKSTRVRDRALEAGSAAHYADPAYYTKTYRDRTEDVRYYVELARRRRGPVLEYGCGNGRILLPTARAGVEVVGVDLSAEMLADLRVALRAEPEVAARVALKRGDMRRVRLGRRFRLVTCPFNAFLHLYTRGDVEAFLARVREHLAPGGELVFDVSVPEPEELARDPQRTHRTPPFLYPGVGRVRYGERFDYDRVRQVLFVSMEFEPKDGEAFTTPLCHRQFFPEELMALLHYNGFAVRARHGGFDGRPFSQESVTMILHARARASR